MSASNSRESTVDLKKALYCVLGWFVLGLGAIGVLLPLLPTTPFVILAAFLFGKGSKKWQDWLLSNRWFGSSVRTYLDTRTISKSAKRNAILTVWIGLVFSTVIMFDGSMNVVLAFMGLGLVLTLVLARIPSTGSDKKLTRTASLSEQV